MIEALFTTVALTCYTGLADVSSAEATSATVAPTAKQQKKQMERQDKKERDKKENKEKRVVAKNTITKAQQRGSQFKALHPEVPNISDRLSRADFQALTAKHGADMTKFVRPT